jgi:predicted short-subunit dehydrogenase-like oxidoreductase (DUF2520 family)
MSKPSIVSVGAGNVASHLIPALYEKQYPVISVYSLTSHNASKLAGLVKSDFTDKFEQIPLDADIYIISLTDHAIEEALDFLKGIDGLVVHTAGSTGIDIFTGKIKKFAVLYPLQTFSKGRKIDLSDVPFLIEASGDETLKIISRLAYELSSDVRQMNSEQRKWVHLGAVFACNFINYMLVCADEVLSSENIDFSILIPLISETISKSVEVGPAASQTGPAFRGNMEVLKKHERLLKDRPDLQNLYTFVSRMIYNYYHKGF